MPHNLGWWGNAKHSLNANPNPHAQIIMKTGLFRIAACLLGTAVIAPYYATAADHYVPANYLTIQDAIDAAASGDTVHIAPGVYGYGVHITNKNLTLIGQNGTIIRERVGFGLIEGLHKSSIVASNAASVVLRGLTFEGDNRGELLGETPWSAVYYANAGGAIENCLFTGFRGIPATGEVSRIQAISIINQGTDNPPTSDIRIAGNTIENCNNGIWVQSDQVGLNATIENNTILGLGPVNANTGIIPLAGITIRNNVNATVTGNTINGFSYAGTESLFPAYVGLLVFGNDWSDFAPTPFMRFENNDLRNNDIHLLDFKGDGHEIINNRFQGTGVAARRAGVQFSGEQVVIRANEFRNMPVGITALGDDPELELIPGVASNAQIVENRFREVETTIEIQDPATASQTGNLIYPFPEPELSIADSVLISWPGYHHDDYLLESAPSTKGPWTEIATELQLVDGSLQATVEVNGEQQYFRLRAP